MTLLHHRWFPQLAGRTWVKVDLDQEARSRTPAHRYPENPILDPAAGWRFVAEIADEGGADYCYGGYLENRVHLLRGTYLHESGRRNLGID